MFSVRIFASIFVGFFMEVTSKDISEKLRFDPSNNFRSNILQYSYEPLNLPCRVEKSSFTIRNHINTEWYLNNTELVEFKGQATISILNASEGNYKCKICTMNKKCIQYETEVKFINELNELIKLISYIMLGVILTLATIFLCYWYHKRKFYKIVQTVKENPKSDRIIDLPLIKITRKKCSNWRNQFGDYNYIFPPNKLWELSRSDFKLGEMLGEGHFGKVFFAESTSNLLLSFSTRLKQKQMTSSNSLLSLICPMPLQKKVAIKMLKDKFDDNDLKYLIHEMEVLKLLGKHDNIINLLGCCSIKGPLWLVVEYAPYGNLKDFLKRNKRWDVLKRTPEISNPGNDVTDTDDDDDDACKQRDDSESENSKECEPTAVTCNNYEVKLSTEQLLRFSLEIARGMEYLAFKNLIHCDLAARNILVGYDYVMKISDFGLTRCNGHQETTNGCISVKWSAPETLAMQVYNTKTDVWSYGIVLWEIMSLGKVPYAKINDLKNFHNHLVSGSRMRKPKYCPKDIYALMLDCWQSDSDKRPYFCEIAKKLSNILDISYEEITERYINEMQLKHLELFSLVKYFI